MVKQNENSKYTPNRSSHRLNNDQINYCNDFHSNLAPSNSIDDNNNKNNNNYIFANNTLAKPSEKQLSSCSVDVQGAHNSNNDHCRYHKNDLAGRDNKNNIKQVNNNYPETSLPTH